MKREKKPGLLLPLCWRGMFDRLSDREAAEMIRAAFRIASGEEVEPKGLPRAVFAYLPQLETFIRADRDNYEKVCENRAKAAKKRWNMQKVQLHTPALQNDASGMQEECKQVQPNANSNSNSNSYIKPPTPLRGIDSMEIKKRWIMRGVGRFYRRRKATAWSAKERAALAEVVKRPDVLAECREIIRFYQGGYEYYRRDVATLLNNWAGELDKARAEPRAVTGRVVGYNQQPPEYRQDQRGKGGLNYG